MKSKSIITTSLFNALGVVLYVALISFLMQNGQQLFGKMESVLASIAFLLLFVMSAATTGYLVFGQPILMYFDGEKKETIKLLGLTVF